MTIVIMEGEEQIMNIPEIIESKMKKKGWTQFDLSRATGIAQPSMSKMLRGEREILAHHMLIIDIVLNLHLNYGKLRAEEQP